MSFFPTTRPHLATLFNHTRKFEYPIAMLFHLCLELKNNGFILEFGNYSQIQNPRHPDFLINKTILELENELNRLGKPIVIDAGASVNILSF